MTTLITVSLDTPAQEMAREEILKQVAFLSRGTANPRFNDDGSRLEFEAPADAAADLAARAKSLAHRVQSGLRRLERKVLFRSPAMDQPEFRGRPPYDGLFSPGAGLAALGGLPLRLHRYFDRAFTELADPWRPTPLLTPTLIPAETLARCDYFRSFPHNVTFACHLHEDADTVEAFRKRHQSRDTLDDHSTRDMDPPRVCLSPAVCYHVYQLQEGRTIARDGPVFEVCGKCFRYESSNMADLRRLWDFTMREIVFLGSRDEVLRHRARSIELIGEFLIEHDLAGEVRTASDPFFIAPDAVAKTYFQLSSETKYEISLALPGGERVAAGSHNHHTDFFGRAFQIHLEEGGFAHSVCVAFGLERWVWAFLAQHGDDPAHWPDVVRRAPEFFH